MGLKDVLKRNSMQSAQHELETRDYRDHDEYTDGTNYYYL